MNIFDQHSLYLYVLVDRAYNCFLEKKYEIVSKLSHVNF